MFLLQTLVHLLLPHHHHDHHEHEEHHHDHEEHHHNHEEHHHHEEEEHEHEHLHRHLLDEPEHHEEHHDHHGDAAFDVYSYFGLEREAAVGILVLVGFLAFLVAEKLANRSLSHSHSHHGGHSHSSHADDARDAKKEEDSKRKDEQPAKRRTTRSATKTAEAAALDSNKKEIDPTLPTIENTGPDTIHYSIFSIMFSKLQGSGWLNLLADSLHNFTDGIAIGASFASGQGLAMATFISVIFHEIPHEIGDFTILVQNGLSKQEAIKAQFLTAIAAFGGTAVGLLAG